MKDSFSIGEFSALFGLKVQTLHYYDSIGLFKPAARDSKTGRRRYYFDQVYKLASIRYMRKLGYSLEQISDYLASLKVGSSVDRLKKRSIELRRQWEELLRTESVIARKISFIERSLAEMGDGIGAVIRTFGPRQYIPIGGEDMLYVHDSFYFYPTIAFYTPKEKFFGAYLYAEDGRADEASGQAGQIETLPAGDYLCAYHRGPYKNVRKTERHLREAHVGLALSELTVDFNIIDQFVEKDSENYVTHMQIKILGS